MATDSRMFLAVLLPKQLQLPIVGSFVHQATFLLLLRPSGLWAQFRLTEPGVHSLQVTPALWQTAWLNNDNRINVEKSETYELIQKTPVILLCFYFRGVFFCFVTFLVSLNFQYLPGSQMGNLVGLVFEHGPLNWKTTSFTVFSHDDIFLFQWLLWSV